MDLPIDADERSIRVSLNGSDPHHTKQVVAHLPAEMNELFRVGQEPESHSESHSESQSSQEHSYERVTFASKEAHGIPLPFGPIAAESADVVRSIGMVIDDGTASGVRLLADVLVEIKDDKTFVCRLPSVQEGTNPVSHGSSHESVLTSGTGPIGGANESADSIQIPFYPNTSPPAPLSSRADGWLRCDLPGSPGSPGRIAESSLGELAFKT